MVEKIVSGGQTGADRAALDFAIRHGIAHGGWCPAGRVAEDGPIHERYLLHETPTAIYAERTERNVCDSDGTAILSVAVELTGGSLATAEFARMHGRPLLHLSRDGTGDPLDAIREFVESREVAVLNVAGPRASEEPDVYAFTLRVLAGLLRGTDTAARGDRGSAHGPSA